MHKVVNVVQKNDLPPLKVHFDTEDEARRALAALGDALIRGLEFVVVGHEAIVRPANVETAYISTGVVKPF